MPFRIFHATCHSESYPHRDMVTRNWQHCLLSCFRIIRAPDRDLFHQFHEKKCDPKLTKDQYRSCLGSKAVAEGTHTQIAIQLTKLREKYESESQENGFSEWKKKTARGTWHGRSWAREKTNEMQGWMKATRKIKMDTILELGSAFNWWNIYTTIQQYCFKHKPVNMRHISHPKSIASMAPSFTSRVVKVPKYRVCCNPSGSSNFNWLFY